MSASESILSPKLYDDVSTLEWLSRRMAQGLMLGKHNSARLGSGMEFTQFRSYVQGDDLRLLDWKMYAKTGKYFIRQSNIDSNQMLYVHIDPSKSMDYEEGGVSKLQLSKLLSASLSYIMTQQSDRFSWECGESTFGTGQGLHHWRRSLVALSELSNTSDFASTSSFELSTFKGVHVWISDLYMDESQLTLAIDDLSGPHKELIVFQLMGRNEEELSFSRNTKFIDLESGEEMQVDTSLFRAEYKISLSNHMKMVKEILDSKGVVYKKIYLDDDIGTVLKEFFYSYNYLSLS